MRTLNGIVTSTKMKKTATVRVDRTWRHPIYKKTVKRHKKYLAQNEIGVKEGDKVMICETKPISKNKHWKIVKIIK